MISLFQQHPQMAVLLVFCLLFALTFHEFGHAYIAYLCGDWTAKLQGRLSLNPLVHLDLLGSVMLVLVGFGYAKPVPVNPRNFRYRSADMYVAAAGPGMNLLLALVGVGLVHILLGNGALHHGSFPTGLFLQWFILINLNLCWLNLIPLGPLDGSYILPYFLPFHLRRRYELWNLRYGGYAILGLFLLSAFSPLNPLAFISSWSHWVMRGLLPG